ncbi:MAG: hypothetical protein A2860_01415 [Candidatus Levybacteria bacterium RIFCSPHIGHO2_01_FULL_37_33]|nr:MAG: hypothetical protein A2860_01415 [Candidatus Levybacteria bacterium RIFCSPHIGHO2_01_FULL_37_33]OGH30067.1 MAG: hypothetical protein A3F30_03645 [Candidatus Levybacteria bacterium RIFCSPHIGHO2_12_FULL_37_12]OGH33092.1 MAG: hypothetical protein A2953_03340 [Candidatus Levybacteria bacterium RIFCSPLOWO2_01_FULL_36_54]
MNNKTLITIIVVLLIVGGGVLLLGKLGNKTNQPANVTNQTPSNAGTSVNTGGEKPKETIANVTFGSSGFDPKTITIKTGTRVIWLNKSGGGATVNSAVHPTHQVYPPLNLGEFPDGSSVQLVFDKLGTYKYHNHLNPSQTGTVVVE